MTGLTIVVETLYNSNVAASDAAIAEARGLKPADEITTPSAVINLARSLLGQVVFLKGNAGYDFYSVNHVLNRERLDLTGGVNANFLTCEELATGEYRRSQTNLVEITSKSVSDTVTTETVQGIVSCGGAMGIAPKISVSETWRSNSDRQQQSANNNFLSVNAALGYRQPAIGVVSVVGQFAEAQFPNVLFLNKDGGSFNSGFDLYSTGLMYERRIGARLDGTASLTYTWLDQFAATLPGFKGYTYLFDFRYLITPRMTARFVFKRAAQPSNEASETFFVDRTYQGSIAYRLSSRINLKLRGYETFRAYGGEGAPAIDELTVSKETIRGVAFTCAYSFTPRLSLALDTGDEERHADIASLGYSAFHVGLTAVARF